MKMIGALDDCISGARYEHVVIMCNGKPIVLN